MAIHSGELKPLFDTDVDGAFSPSPSLRVERHRLKPMSWPSVVIPKQVITLSLTTHEVSLNSSGVVVRYAGTVSIQKRDCEHSICWRSPATTLSVELDDTVLEDAQSAAQLGEDNAQIERLSPLLYAVEQERQKGYPLGRLFLDGVAQAIACVVASSTARVRPDRAVPLLAPYQMRRVKDYVEAHLDKKVNLSDMSREAGLSPSHFARLFRRSSGTTPHQYVLERRIDHAKTLLTDPRHSLLDIALAAGFRTHQHFSRVFHQVTGSSPRQYRLQI